MRTFITLALFIFALYTSLVAADDLPAVVLKGAGATLPVSVIATGTPLTPSWINAFQTLTGGLVTSSYSPTGSGEGEVSILSKQVDYAVTSAPLSDSEQLTANDTLLHFPILLGALDITYFFPAGTIKGALNLTADIISGIFQGSISDWGNTLIRAVNPNLNYTGRIFPVARFDSAGATQVFTKYLNLATVDIPWQLPVDKKITWPRNVTVVISDNSLVKAVGSTAGAIGYTNYGTATAFNLPSAAIRNADGYFVFPSQQSIKAAADAFEAGGQYPEGGDSWSHVTLVNQPGTASYPLTHYEYALFYKDQRSNGARGAALAAFMNFVVSTQAQTSAPIFKYAPLGNLVRATNIASINYMLIDDDYTVTSYWNPYPAPTDNEDHELVQGTIASLIVISLFGAIIIVGIVVFGFLEWRTNDIEFL